MSLQTEEWDPTTIQLATNQPVYTDLPDRTALQQKVWDTLGIVKSEQKLKQFLTWLTPFTCPDTAPQSKASGDMADKSTIEISNLCLIAKLIAESALKRQENIGAHYRIEN